MQPADLFQQLCDQGAIPPSRAKDIKTSLRYLAQALNTTPNALADADSLNTGYRNILQSFFAGLESPPSPHTIRNTLNNLSFLFRTAHAHGLIQTFKPRPERMTHREAHRVLRATSPYRTRVGGYLTPIRRPVDTWPTDIRNTWIDYRTARQFEVRSATLNLYERMLTTYMGYALTVEQPPITTWAEIFDPPRLQRFIQWHVRRVGARRMTTTGHDAVRIVTMLARHYQRPELPALQKLSKKLPTPEAMHDKQSPQHTITLKELEDVALTMLAESRKPPFPNASTKKLSSQRASGHQFALMIRLLVRVPMRSRNIREMCLGQHLYQDGQGTWQLRFHGDDLKIRERQGRINKFEIPFPPDLTDHLEEFLTHRRPNIKNSDTNQHVFLSMASIPFSASTLRHAFHARIFARIGKRFYPHLIRTIWTDTCLLQTHDVSTAAFMLNDDPMTVLKRYHELRANDHIQKANQFTQSLLGK
jgi:hypothetical protein